MASWQAQRLSWVQSILSNDVSSELLGSRTESQAEIDFFEAI